MGELAAVGAWAVVLAVIAWLKPEQMHLLWLVAIGLLLLSPLLTLFCAVCR